MDKTDKRLMKMSKQLADIEQTLRRIERLVVQLYEIRFAEPSYQSRPPPKSKIDPSSSLRVKRMRVFAQGEENARLRSG